jgi:hypothetical protein
MVAELSVETRLMGRKLASTAHKDPTDAAQVPPSVMQEAIGKPELAHDDIHHNRERRHSLKTSQEVHHGL